jgi:hypothetical protein
VCLCLILNRICIAWERISFHFLIIWLILSGKDWYETNPFISTVRVFLPVSKKIKVVFFAFCTISRPLESDQWKWDRAYSLTEEIKTQYSLIWSISLFCFCLSSCNDKPFVGSEFYSFRRINGNYIRQLFFRSCAKSSIRAKEKSWTIKFISLILSWIQFWLVSQFIWKSDHVSAPKEVLWAS